jgi:UDP-N-acetylglucosamine acyltransferase
MAEIHPSAIVDEQATLADDVTVGPGCIIEGRVELGPGTHLLHRVSLRGPLIVGEANTFYPNAAIGYEPQDLKFDPATEGAGVVIGDRNVFREGVTIHRATGEQPTSIGSDNMLMANSHVAHDCMVGDHVVMANAATLGGHVQVHDRAFLGGHATVHQHCRVGRLALASGLQGLSMDLPPFCVCYYTRTVGSLNLVGLRRNGLRDHIKPLKQAFRLFYMSRLTNPKAIERIEQEAGDDPLVAEFVAFLRETKRGITAYGGSRESGRRDAD